MLVFSHVGGFLVLSLLFVFTLCCIVWRGFVFLRVDGFVVLACCFICDGFVFRFDVWFSRVDIVVSHVGVNFVWVFVRVAVVCVSVFLCCACCCFRVGCVPCW